MSVIMGVMNICSLDSGCQIGPQPYRLACIEMLKVVFHYCVQQADTGRIAHAHLEGAPQRSRLLGRVPQSGLPVVATIVFA